MSKQKTIHVLKAEYEDMCEWCGKHIAVGDTKVIREDAKAFIGTRAYCSKKCERADR